MTVVRERIADLGHELFAELLHQLGMGAHLLKSREDIERGNDCHRRGGDPSDDVLGKRFEGAGDVIRIKN